MRELQIDVTTLRQRFHKLQQKLNLNGNWKDFFEGQHGRAGTLPLGCSAGMGTIAYAHARDRVRGVRG